MIEDLTSALAKVIVSLDSMRSMGSLSVEESAVVAKLELARDTLASVIEPQVIRASQHSITVQALEDEIEGEQDTFLPGCKLRRNDGLAPLVYFRLRQLPTMEFMISVDTGHTCTVYVAKELGQGREVVTFVDNMQDFHSKMLMLRWFSFNFMGNK